MESPPSYSNSEAPLLSEDSGLFITSGSFSSDSASGWHQITSELQESDYDDHSLSLCESTETSEYMYGDNFNTVKKGPVKSAPTTIEPPPEFQDCPVKKRYINSTVLRQDVPTSISNSNYKLESITLDISMPKTPPKDGRKNQSDLLYERRQCLSNRFSPRLLHLSPCHGNRPSSRNSLTSRRSNSHNSLIAQMQADDSSFITQAISHDVLSTKISDIPDMYNVPFDSDIYAVPIDMVRPNQNNVRYKGKKVPRGNKKRNKVVLQTLTANVTRDKNDRIPKSYNKEVKTKRYSLPGSSVRKSITESDTQSLHMTLCDMRKYLHTLYSSSSSIENKNNVISRLNTFHRDDSKEVNTRLYVAEKSVDNKDIESNSNHKKSNNNSFCINTKSKKHRENNVTSTELIKDVNTKKTPVQTHQQAKIKNAPIRIWSLNFKQSFCNLFRWRRQPPVDTNKVETISPTESVTPPVVKRALPPLPQSSGSSQSRANGEEIPMDFATSIQKVKDYGWYWGPISVEAAEKILSSEPDGSFIVRDSSDDHYIFTLTFKLNGLRHVRIEHDQGNFCFGGCTMFKAPSIVEFINKAVETSRNGRYLFFLHLRPVLGPVRVQLLYPVSRFKRVQSLQHLCRFQILKFVRRDLINQLPLPQRILDYLSATHYYSEMLADI